MVEAIAGVILAGGRSQRMGGGDKVLKPLCGRPLLAHVIDGLMRQAMPLAINANGDPDRFRAFGLPVLPDRPAESRGPLSGILAAMRWAAGDPGTSRVVTVAGDTPFFPPDLVARLRDVEANHPGRIVLAADESDMHPVFGLWPVALADDLDTFLAGPAKSRIADWAGRHGFETVKFPPLRVGAREVRPFFNVNTPDELAEAESLCRELPAMKQRVIGITGWKNSGKTTLTERLVAEFSRRGLKVATVKHAHHEFDVDQPGTDSFRHRKAGAAEVAIVSSRRWVLMHELLEEDEPALADILARLSPCDIVLIEGYKREPHPKIECRRAEARIRRG